MKNLPNPEFDKYGYIQIYTGLGKAKTTAAMGLVCRALGRKFEVCIMQFCKDKNQTGEYKYFSENFNDNLDYLSSGLPHYPIPTKANITTDDKIKFIEGWEYIRRRQADYDLIVLDELTTAIDFGFILVEEVVLFLKDKPEHLEIVITGRNAQKELIEVADLVTEMLPIKHYWDKGVKARLGIEY